MVKQVQRWEAKDGALFEHEEQAAAHERKLEKIRYAEALASEFSGRTEFIPIEKAGKTVLAAFVSKSTRAMIQHLLDLCSSSDNS